MDIFFDFLIIVIGMISVICVSTVFLFQIDFWHNKKYNWLYLSFFVVCGFIFLRWVSRGSFDQMPILPFLAALGLLVQFGAFKEQWQDFQKGMFWHHSARGRVSALYLLTLLSFVGVRAASYLKDNYLWLNSMPCVVTELQTKVGEMEDSYDDGSPTGKMLATKELYLYARPLSSDTMSVKLRLARVVARNSSQSADKLQVSSFYKVGDTVNVYKDIIVGKP